MVTASCRYWQYCTTQPKTSVITIQEVQFVKVKIAERSRDRGWWGGHVAVTHNDNCYQWCHHDVIIVCVEQLLTTDLHCLCEWFQLAQPCQLSICGKMTLWLWHMAGWNNWPLDQVTVPTWQHCLTIMRLCFSSGGHFTPFCRTQACNPSWGSSINILNSILHVWKDIDNQINKEGSLPSICPAWWTSFLFLKMSCLISTWK